MQQSLSTLFTRILVILLLMASAGLHAVYGQKYPVTANVTLTPPYSTYVSDYISPTSNLLTTTFVFNDFREPTWQVRLRLRIESMDLRLQTRPEFRPATPITVTPGVSVTVTGADLAQYFDFQNLAIAGGATERFLQNGRFPEGNYTFCIDVLDYQTGVVLSNPACASAWIRLNDPPRTISPVCGAYVDPTQPLNIPFQWQQSNIVSPNATMGTEYRLVVYELTDPAAAPHTAVNNAKVLQIYASDALQQSSFHYNTSHPALDRGKAYIYQVKATDIGGRDLFKNNGLSEVCWFYYGYPENTLTTLQAPAVDKAFTKSEQPYFKWTAPDRHLVNQPFVYELKIVQLTDEHQDLQQAIETNPVWYTEKTTQTFSDRGMDVVIKRKLQPARSYAWQVITYSKTQTVSKSEVRRFKGPPIIDKFFAGRHTVVVTRATTNDSLNFAGTGRLKINQTDSTTVEFSGLKLRRVVNYWVLTEGEIVKTLENGRPITIKPTTPANGTATFYPVTLKLDAKELALEGDVRWAFPHAVTSGDAPYVRSEKVWLNYDKYTLMGSAPFTAANQFELLEPFEFRMLLSKKSDFLIAADKFELRAEGDIELPALVKGKQKTNVKVPFPRTAQLFYIKDLPVIMENEISLVQNTRVYLRPSVVTIDLTENESPGSGQHVPDWKGIHLQQYDLQYMGGTDKFTQLDFPQDVVQTLVGDEAARTNAWVDTYGMNLTLSRDFAADAMIFNTFPSVARHIDLTLLKNEITESRLQGGMLIPVFSTTEHFAFTVPITAEGFRPGYLDDIDGRHYTFNKGAGEQEINVTITRGVFAEQRMVDMVVDLQWPSLGITAGGVSGFRAWGNYAVGFTIPNGVRALDEQLEGTLSGYRVTVDGIAAGSYAGLYSFAITGKAVLSQDVSGNEGPPSINVYTIMPNTLLPRTADQGTGGTKLTPAEVAQLQAKDIEEQYAAQGKRIEDDLADAEEEIKAAAAETQSMLAASGTPVTPDEAETSASEDGNTEIELPQSGGLLGKLKPKQREVVKNIIAKVMEQLLSPVTDSINAVADRVNNRVRQEIGEIARSINDPVHDQVASLVNKVAEGIISVTKNPTVDIEPQIRQMAEGVTESVAGEVKRSVNASLEKNITTPITSLVQNDIAGRVNTFITEASTKLVIDALEGKTKLDEIPETLLSGADTVFTAIARDVFAAVSFSRVTDMLSGTVRDAIAGVSIDNIYNELKSGAAGVATRELKGKANELAQNYINDAIGLELPIDFVSLPGKIASGNIKDIFALDPVPVKLKSAIMELNGMIYYTADEPTYGDVWMGDIDIFVKKPKPFSLGATYINGKKDGLSYWFAQVVAADDKTTRLGDVMPKKAKALKNPIGIGVADIVGVSGRVYHHMRDEDGKPIVPDGDVAYGAYLNLIFFDKANGGKTMRLDVAGEINTKENGDYVLTFEGNLQLMSIAPQVTEIDPSAAVQGMFKFSYNSAEEHFLGYGRVEIKKPGQLCASGSVMVDTKPGKWRVEIGSREDRITFVPACYGWSPTGWLAITESEAELGLGIQYSIYAQSPTANFVIVKANVALDAGVAFGIQAAVRYKPDFALLRAGVWADVWADVVINYKKNLPLSKWKSFSILSIYGRGDMLIIFDPKPTTMEGTVEGRVRLLSLVTLNFKSSFKKELS